MTHFPYADWQALLAEGQAGGYTMRLSNSGCSMLAVFISDNTRDHRKPETGDLTAYHRQIDEWLQCVLASSTPVSRELPLVDLVAKLRDAVEDAMSDDNRTRRDEGWRKFNDLAKPYPILRILDRLAYLDPTFLPWV